MSLVAGPKARLVTTYNLNGSDTLTQRPQPVRVRVTANQARTRAAQFNLKLRPCSESNRERSPCPVPGPCSELELAMPRKGSVGPGCWLRASPSRSGPAAPGPVTVSFRPPPGPGPTGGPGTDWQPEDSVRVTSRPYYLNLIPLIRIPLFS
jgi:hypothetical protein